jgi:hypothetical protein
MCSITLVVGALLLPVQVPSPTAAENVAKELRAAHSEILTREKAALLAVRLEQDGSKLDAAHVRGLLPPAPTVNGPTHFVPLPDVIAARPPRAPSPVQTEIDSIRESAANRLFALGLRATDARPPHFALATQCLREVLERSPDHREARRLMGYVPYSGGWARPFAVEQFSKGYVKHPIFGWVKADWVPQLDQGYLPGPTTRGSNKVQWLTADEADRLRSGWKPPWHISTEHFEIQTSVTLAETISFGRRLEAFHDLFFSMMADVLGENLPLARRRKDSKMVGEPSNKPHVVYFFGSKEEYIAYFENRADRPDLEGSLGYYEPPKPGSGNRGRAYFFRDPNGQLPLTATLYHEVSHQLLFENAGPYAFAKNVGNYWVFEGLGTYFETVQARADGSLEVGGLVGRRIDEAIKSIVIQSELIPLDRFIQYDQADFNREQQIYLNYQQAMALTTFLMQWHDGQYREPFLAYVRDAYRGRIKRTTGRTLQDRLGVSHAALENQFLSYLRDPIGLTRTEPAADTGSKASIRTVPRQ